MSTETLNPVSLTSEQSRDSGFFENVLEAQAVQPVKSKRNREAKPVVESIDPTTIHLYHDIDLGHVSIARESLGDFDNDSDEYDAEKEFLLDTIFEGLDPELPAYARNRAEIAKLMSLPDEKFVKTTRKLENAQARLEGVKLVRPKAEKTEQGSVRFMPKTVERLMDAATEHKNRVTEKGLRRDIKAVDRHFGGLLGEVAETGTKASYLEAKYDEFSTRMETHGANVNDKTRRSVERETVRSLMNAEDLADRQGLEGDERRNYIDDLVDTFHDYVTLDDAERERFNQTLAARHKAAELLTDMERDNAADTGSELAEKEPRESRRSRLIRSLGSTAAGVVAASRNRWEARRAHSDDEQPGLFDDKPYRTKGKLASATRSLANKPNELYHSANARFVESQRRRQEKLAAMSDEEREDYENKKRRNRKAILAVGGAALAVTVAAYAAKYGIDHWGNNNHGGSGSSSGELPGGTTHDGFRDMDLDGIPDSFDIDGGNGTGIPTPEGAPTDGGGGANTELTRQELFDGRGGSRSLSGANASELRDFLADYKVKASDNKGVWGISTKYLQSQGVSNPTVYEVDAVKDYILNNSSLTNSSIIHPGDTIKLK